ncbi:hypothetical protein DPMN_191987 [Dreissena polymorpha]|uniref:Uncharacterized protein n=1 Tax=Dreissena polymorpha TaxID=45954 RepID=A0A9D3Y0L1_DREPO|nr:hypothetical protein DPMN_191987 [Dreissena polymorpha]
MENMELNESSNDTETCDYTDTYVTSLFIPVCFCALLGIATYLVHAFFHKRFKTQILERAHIEDDTITHDNVGGFIEQTTIYTRHIVEDTEIAIKEHQQDCMSEILAAINNRNEKDEDSEIALKEHQLDCTSEILEAINNLNRNIDAVPKKDNGESNKDKDSNNKAALGQDEYVTECQSEYTHSFK